MLTDKKIAATEILEKARLLKPGLIEHRRHIHSHPELSFQEKATASYVADKLNALGYKVLESIGDTGVTAEIGDGDTVIGIRADMDALPIQETNPQSYCSSNAGVMHACGHDAHTSCAIGAANMLAELKSAGGLPGRFRFLFQPAEEAVNEQGLSGASLMIRDGCLEDMKALVGIHVHPGMPTGTLGFREGTFLAACDSFDIKVIGKGGHGAYPEDTVDAVLLASGFVQSLQTLISRRKSALSPAVLTIGGIRSNTFRSNIVAGEVELTGTVRYFDPNLSEFFESEIKKMGQTLEPLGGKIELHYRRENPTLVNDAATTAKLKEVAISMIGSQRVVDLPLELGSEDFSFYTKTVPSVFALVGCGIEGSPREIHTSTFDINEDALVYGAALLASSALALSESS